MTILYDLAFTWEAALFLVGYCTLKAFEQFYLTNIYKYSK